MTNAVNETSKRLKLADKIASEFSSVSRGIILAGSVAYSPNLHVTQSSDLDMLIIIDNLKKIIPKLIGENAEAEALQKRVFDGYSVKLHRDGISVSVHVLNSDAFDVVCKCFVADIRMYRTDAKPGSYMLNDFEGNTYQFYIKNIPLDDLKGVRTIVPVSFINQDRYYLGIHRDKLFSNPQIMQDVENSISSGMDKLWINVITNLYDESRRIYGVLDLNKRSIVHALSRKHKMPEDILRSLDAKTQEYIEKLRL